MKFFVCLIFVSLCTGLAFSQDFPWVFGGQVQIRTEADGRDFNNKSYMTTMTVMRTRLSAAKKFDENVEFFFQAQDSRLFGQEGSPSTYTKNLDIYQANIKLNKILQLPVSLQVGRFALSYGTERFLGASNWSYIGRAFDGVRLSFEGTGKLDFFGVTTNDMRSYVSNAQASTYPSTLPFETTSSLYGFWYNSNLNKDIKIDLFTYYDLNRRESNGKDPDNSVITLGTTVQAQLDPLQFTFEGAYQGGKRAALDVSAYLLSLSGTFAAKAGKLGLGADVISGTDEPLKDNNVFSTTYGTNHKFYGYMDYFIDMYSNTYAMGLMDIYATFDASPGDSPVGFSANLHHFISSKKPKGYEGTFGQEIDLTLRYQFARNTTVTWGGSFFLPGDFMKAIFKTSLLKREDTAIWSYVMITANF